ncbi:MAG: hypothetical protein E4H17_04320, partial [Gemmatimonadales bacterium]
MSRFAYSVLTLMVMLLLPACGTQRKAAEASISAAQAAYDEIRDEAMNVAPDQARMIEDAIATARADVEKGDPKAALEATRDLPAKVKELDEGLYARAGELQAAWKGLNATLPSAVASLDKRMGAMARPPAGMNRADFAIARTTLADMKTRWGEATTAMKDGKLAEAVTRARGVKASAVDLMTEMK